MFMVIIFKYVNSRLKGQMHHQNDLGVGVVTEDVLAFTNLALLMVSMHNIA